MIRRLIRSLGFDLMRWPPVTYDMKRRIKLVQGWQIDRLLDVGANEGQYASQMRNLGYRGAIDSFEPFDKARQKLQEIAAGSPPWTVHSQALSDVDEEGILNIAGNSQSSSVLAMNQVHLEAAPDSAYVGTQKVRLRRLDGMWNDLQLEGHATLLKIDAQGLEKKILQGCGEKLGQCRALQLELSLEPMYQGESSLQEMLAWLKERNFELVSLEPGFDDKASGRLLQVDGLFEKKT